MMQNLENAITTRCSHQEGLKEGRTMGQQRHFIQELVEIDVKPRIVILCSTSIVRAGSGS